MIEFEQYDSRDLDQLENPFMTQMNFLFKKVSIKKKKYIIYKIRIKIYYKMKKLVYFIVVIRK